MNASDPKAEIRRTIRDAERIVPPSKRIPAGWAFFPSDLQDRPIPPRQWCVEGWIPDKVVTLLSGDGGTGKSLLAMTLAACCASGQSFLGIEVGCRKVLYLFAEDDVEEAWRRQDAINRVLGIDFADLDDRLAWVLRAGEDTFLMTVDKAGRPKTTPLFDNLESYARATGVQLVIVDTIADTFGGLEIDRQQVTRFVRNHQRLAADINGAVVLIGHPSVAGLKEGRPASGSNAWVNAVRSALFLRRPNDDEAPEGDARDVRVLQRAKSNFSAAGAEIRLRYLGGAFFADHAPNDTPGVMDNIAAEVAVMKAIVAALRNGVFPSPSRNSDQYAPKVLRKYPEVKNYTVKMIEAAIERMTGKRELREATLGTGNNRRKVICPADHPPLPDEREPLTGERKRPAGGAS